MADIVDKPVINWRIVPEATSQYSIMLVLDEDVSAMGMLKASAKWDGCTHLWLDGDEWQNGSCYHHICDIDEFVLYLSSMREKAHAYFGGEFGIAPLNDQQYQERIAEFQRQE